MEILLTKKQKNHLHPETIFLGSVELPQPQKVANLTMIYVRVP